jgi:preprotein translocase subunit SecF
VVCELKEREPKYAALAKRVAARKAAEARGETVPASGVARKRPARGANVAAPRRAGATAVARDTVLDEEPVADEAPADDVQAEDVPAEPVAAPGATRVPPRPGARPNPKKRPAPKRGGGRPSAKKRR